MEDDHDKSDAAAAPEKPPKIKANDNPWYLLATLYGEPADQPEDDRRRELQDRNRFAWNRYFSSNLDDATRARLIDEKRYPAEELTPISADELNLIAQSFVVRSRNAGAELSLPPASEQIDFKRVEFGRDADFSGYLFAASAAARQIGYPVHSGAMFRGATFCGHANFSGATYFGGADFRNAIFRVRATFAGGATIAGVTEFSRVTFAGLADFRSTTFRGATRFESATFHEAAVFSSATFVGGSGFDDAKFCSIADFEDATFSVGYHRFKGVNFSQFANFRSANFSGLTTFDSSKFQGYAWFHDTTFSGQISFENTIFCDRADFIGAVFMQRADFANAKFRSEASFERATFHTEPPRFFGAELHEGTVWRGIKDWPTPKTAAEAGPFIDAYERLKLEMDGLQKHEDELNFFALEFQSRRVMVGPWKGWPISVYGAVSDYGRSYWLPLGWLACVVMVGAFLLAPYLDVTLKQPLESTVGKSLGLSLANTLNVFGFRKDFIDASLVEHLPWGLKVLAGLQTILGGVLLFLFGLGIRNRFRMK